MLLLLRTPAASHRRPLEIIILWIDPLELSRIDRLPGEEYGEGSAWSVQNWNSEPPENIICIMFGGSGPECVQNSNSEDLRGTKYHKIHRMEAKSLVDFQWAGESGGRAEL